MGDIASSFLEEQRRTLLRLNNELNEELNNHCYTSTLLTLNEMSICIATMNSSILLAEVLKP